MESAPPGSVALNGCPAWRVAIAAVTLAVVGAMAAWMFMATLSGSFEASVRAFGSGSKG